MTPAPTLAVTGSTGALGALVARGVADAGIPQRLLVRTPANAPELPGSVVMPFSYADRAACAAALSGVHTLFMVSASESADRVDQHRAFIESAAAAGVRHIVYTSFLAASPTATFTLARDHFVTEQLIRATGIPHTFLRDSLYLDFMPALVGADGVIRGPAGDGRVAGVTRADVARTAIAVLRDPGAHANVTYDLTGPEALTMAEIAAVLTEITGTPVAFHNESIAEAYESRRPWAAPDWQNDAWVSTYTAIADGSMSTVSGDVQRVTGVPPQGLRELLSAT
ncbi:SDR family oxidoreductase [Cryobacterium arcticum]|uniref:NAD(P)-dependent oxidoreductase n=1 Tax=Cryobacterium arcticum TaxID=670052 RepID=A0A317ZUU7_9MICO|nr:SDR family oxidoreductase [Cryobacterium arcticum]PXA67927.1 NAD(P)-dependent oxidoreductase [Cryobacterium arcticum]